MVAAVLDSATHPDAFQRHSGGPRAPFATKIPSRVRRAPGPPPPLLFGFLCSHPEQGIQNPCSTRKFPGYFSAVARLSGREAQWRPCRIEPGALKEVDDWLARYRRLWDERFDRLGVYLQELQAKEKKRGRKK